MRKAKSVIEKEAKNLKKSLKGKTIEDIEIYYESYLGYRGEGEYICIGSITANGIKYSIESYYDVEICKYEGRK